jgi:hypothetical protein
MTIGLNGGMNRYIISNRTRLFGIKDDSKNKHMKSTITYEQKYKDNLADKLNIKHHQSVMVFSSNQNQSVIVEAIGPQRTKM